MAISDIEWTLRTIVLLEKALAAERAILEKKVGCHKLTEIEWIEERESNY